MLPQTPPSLFPTIFYLANLALSNPSLPYSPGVFQPLTIILTSPILTLHHLAHPYPLRLPVPFSTFLSHVLLAPVCSFSISSTCCLPTLSPQAPLGPFLNIIHNAHLVPSTHHHEITLASFCTFSIKSIFLDFKPSLQCPSGIFFSFFMTPTLHYEGQMVPF